MDLSGLIFVVLALAWAGYLIPRALRHHDDLDATGSVEEFSDTMRVLARRKPTTVLAGPSTPEEAAPRVARPGSAARRRRRVLGALVVVLAAVAALAGFAVVSWWWLAVPGVLVGAWLIACVTMAANERKRKVPAVTAEVATPAPEAVIEDTETTDTEDALWDPLPLTLPTYVTKPAARRTVRTIDLTRPVEQKPAVSEPAPAAAKAV